MDKAKEKVGSLKRHSALIPLSKDHHFGLLLCWKIRMGIRKAVPSKRIAHYVAYFYKNHLKGHFEEEEVYVFSLLDEKNEKRKKAESQHRKIKRLVRKLSLEPEKLKITLGQIEEEVEAHIRFEERILFPYIQTCLDEPDLERLKRKLEAIHKEVPEKWEDQFWEE